MKGLNILLVTISFIAGISMPAIAWEQQGNLHWPTGSVIFTVHPSSFPDGSEFTNALINSIAHWNNIPGSSINIGYQTGSGDCFNHTDNISMVCGYDSGPNDLSTPLVQIFPKVDPTNPDSGKLIAVDILFRTNVHWAITHSDQVIEMRDDLLYFYPFLFHATALEGIGRALGFTNSNKLSIFKDGLLNGFGRYRLWADDYQAARELYPGTGASSDFVVSNFTPVNYHTDFQPYPLPLGVGVAGGSSLVKFTLENAGNLEQGGVELSFYLSSDRELSDDDLILSSERIDLPAHFSATIEREIPLPAGLELGDEYYLGVSIDPDNEIVEFREDDNIRFHPDKIRVVGNTVSVPSDFASIQRALDSVVAPGTVEVVFQYITEPIRIRRDSITLKRALGSTLYRVEVGPDANGVGIEGFYFEGADAGISVGPNSSVRIANNTIHSSSGNYPVLVEHDANGALIINNKISGDSSSAGVMLMGGSSLLMENQIHDNAEFGVEVWSDRPQFIYNNIINKNQGGGISSDYANLSIINNTIVENDGAGVDVRGESEVRNNIISSNNIGISGDNTLQNSYNNVWANGLDYSGVVAGTGSISADPMFDYSYKLKIGSPAIDAGDPQDNASEEPAPNGGRINLGRYGGTKNATRSVEACSITGASISSTTCSSSGCRSNDSIEFEIQHEGPGCQDRIQQIYIRAQSIDYHCEISKYAGNGSPGIYGILIEPDNFEFVDGVISASWVLPAIPDECAGRSVIYKELVPYEAGASAGDSIPMEPYSGFADSVAFRIAEPVSRTKKIDPRMAP